MIYLLEFRSLSLPAETLRKEKTRRQERMLRKNTRHAFLRVRICHQQKLSADGHVRAMRLLSTFILNQFQLMTSVVSPLSDVIGMHANQDYARALYIIIVNIIGNTPRETTRHKRFVRGEDCGT